MTVFANLDHGFGIQGMTTDDILLEVVFENYTGPTANNRTIFSGQWDEAGSGSGYVYLNGGSNSLTRSGVSDTRLDGVAINTFAPADVTGGNVFSGIVSGHGGDLVVANRWSLDEPINCEISAVTVKSADGLTTLHTFDLSSPSSTDVPDTTGSATGTLLNFEMTPSVRKGSTFDLETTLSGTVTAATLNGNAITVDSQAGTTVTLTDSDGSIATSGEYDLVLTDDSADPDETITVQVNVVGLSSNTAKKDGGLLVSLTDLTLDAVNASGTLVKQLTGLTTDASGVISPVDLSDISEAVGDTLKVSLHSAASDVGVTFEQALELI